MSIGPIGRVCPTCRNAVDPADKFCRNCGTPLAPATAEPAARQDYLELDDDSRTLAAGYVPPVAPPPFLPDEPAIDRSIQTAPNTLAGGYAMPPPAASVPAGRAAAPPGSFGQGTTNLGVQAGRCPRCGLNLPVYREKCPNCGAHVLPLAEGSFADDGFRPRINVGAYELTKWPHVDFLAGVAAFFLLYAIRYIPGLDILPLVLIPVTWMVSRLFWRWFARGLGLATLIAMVVTISLVVQHFRAHPITAPTITMPDG